MPNIRYLRLLQEAADGRFCRSVYGGCSLASALGVAIFSGSDTWSGYGVSTSHGLRHNHQR
jgi:hypothetical protein